MIKKFHTVICGSGPAGLAAALASIKAKRRTLLLEKNPEAGRKLLASGSGKCNFSNNLPEDVFMSSFGRNGRFMTEALRFFGQEKLLEYLRSQHVPSVLVEERFYFPASLKAADIRNAFLRPALEGGLIFKSGTAAKHLLLENNSIAGVELADGTQIACQKVVLASGGNAMPQLGASSSGLTLAQEAGHTIVPPLPAMAPLCLAQAWAKELSGISLPDAELFLSSGNTSLKSRGTLLFTHDGISGMAALNLSDTAYRMWQKKPQKVKITLNFSAEKSLSDWDKIITSARAENQDKLLKTALSSFFPKALAFQICCVCGLENHRLKDLKVQEKELLLRHLCAMPLAIEKLCPMEKAMAMSGGVSLKEINPDDMSSRLCKGLFFAGEIMDLTGPCGGFNIQFAFSSGMLAGSAAEENLPYQNSASC